MPIGPRRTHRIVSNWQCGGIYARRSIAIRPSINANALTWLAQFFEFFIGIVAMLAQRLQFAEQKLVPITTVWRDVINNSSRTHKRTFAQTHCT